MLAGLPGLATAAPILLGPTPYLSFNDSPFAVGSFAYFHLEDFEDGVLNTPGVSLSVTSLHTSVTPPSMFTDSVDADDGSIDGSGQGGHSLYLGNLETAPGPSSATFTFDATSLGALPTHVGIVWTDVGFSTNPLYGFGLVTFEAFDASASSLGIIGPTAVGGLAPEKTAEDRFFGVTNPSGISKIIISMNSHDWEMDHLQYGRDVVPVPEPSTWLLFTSGLAMTGMILWKKRRA